MLEKEARLVKAASDFADDFRGSKRVVTDDYRAVCADDVAGVIQRGEQVRVHLAVLQLASGEV